MKKWLLEPLENKVALRTRIGGFDVVVTPVGGGTLEPVLWHVSAEWSNAAHPAVGFTASNLPIALDGLRIKLSQMHNWDLDDVYGTSRATCRKCGLEHAPMIGVPYERDGCPWTVPHDE